MPSQAEGHNNDTLTIYGATPHDEGMYYCIAEESGITVKSNSASVQIDGKHLAKFLLHDQSFTIAN